MEELKNVALATMLLSIFGGLPSIMEGQALPTATGPGSYLTVGGGASLFQTDYGQEHLAGMVFYADVNPTWRYGLEAEVRRLGYHSSEGVSEADYLIGPRVVLRSGRLRPYAKFLLGSGHIVLPYSYGEANVLAYAPGGGIDYLAGERIAFRIVDFECQSWRALPFGSLRPYGISAGISVRLNGVDRYPKKRLSQD